jgi:hypothetical protein
MHSTPTTPVDTSPDMEYVPTADSLRRIKYQENVLFLIGTILVMTAVCLTRNPVFILMGVLGAAVVAMLLKHNLRFLRQVHDPAWLAANTPRIRLSADGLLVTFGDSDPQGAAWADLDDVWLSRAAIIVQRRDRAGHISLPSHFFTFTERRAIVAELRRRIQAAAHGTR